jgi:hypothetical protein
MPRAEQGQHGAEQSLKQVKDLITGCGLPRADEADASIPGISVRWSIVCFNLSSFSFVFAGEPQ